MTTQTADVLYCEGYRKLLAAVEADEVKNPKFHDYRAKLAWAVKQARHYADKTGLTPEAMLDAWEAGRTYWYMNYYQEANQPTIAGDSVRVFETVADLLKSIGKPEFRCPRCKGVSKSPNACDVPPCDWKAYGLFGTMGLGASVFVKEKLRIENIFMPVAWEINKAESRDDLKAAIAGIPPEELAACGIV